MSALPTTILGDLYAYNDWANGRTLQLCEGLSDDQLDQERALGWGSLRGTLFHIVAAERIWLDRWLGRAWAPLPTEAQSASVVELTERFHVVSQERATVLEDERRSNFARIVKYRDGQGQAYAHGVGDLMLHVANHGIHHRAQALSYLKSFGRTVPAGLDYLFFKLAYPTTEQSAESIEALKAYGLEIDSGPGEAPQWDGPFIKRYFAYNDWAMNEVAQAAASLDDRQLDHEFDLGIGSIRKNLLHICDAERWWGKCWTAGPSAFEKSPTETSLADWRSMWDAVVNNRSQFLSQLDAGAAQRSVTVQPGGPPVRFRVIESLIQLCGHGAHHRAQLANMLRQSGVQPPKLDYLMWIRDGAPGAAASTPPATGK